MAILHTWLGYFTKLFGTVVYLGTGSRSQLILPLLQPHPADVCSDANDLGVHIERYSVVSFPVGMCVTCLRYHRHRP